MRIVLAALMLAYGTQLNAEIISCDFDSYHMQGSYIDKSGRQQYLRKVFGSGFRLDKTQNTIQIIAGETFYKPIKIQKTSKTKNFTAYIFRLNTNGSSYSYRIYDYGETEVIVTPSAGYVPMQAMGHCKALDLSHSQSQKSTRRLSVPQEVQKELNRLGCNVGKADGSIGPASKRGLKQFAKANKAFSYDVSVFSDPDFLKLLQAKRAGFCNP
jgi:hypothetical protein